MKKLIILFFMILLFLSTVNVVSAGYFPIDVFTSTIYSGNDAKIETINSNHVIELGEIDSPGTTSGNFTINYIDKYHGTWSSTIPIQYISLKSSTEFIVYSVIGLTSGTWDTSSLSTPSGNTPALSHMSFWSTTPVPIPAAAWLFGTGIVGIVSMRRRLNS